ncbi:uncharacterized protein LOC128841608 [Malaclemys terrapin pileata]|uniref:uncharacterized protein LOC128841608 n=1 Tax=Malaclemys terrapin pileata TaxID=2991368 RepID=UPI0023A8B3FF|nr:uncharacterized protein LOC128841608 [Malaclemys terrapin pileata]
MAGRARCTPLECILVNWKVFGSDPLIKSKLKRFCTVDWPQYQLEDQERWPQEGSLNYNTILQLLLFCQRTGKWNEHMYVQLFMLLRDRLDILQKCNLTPTGSVVATVSSQNPPTAVMADPVSPSAITPPPYKDKVSQVPEIAPSVEFYPLITETVVSRHGSDRNQATTMQVYTHMPFNPVDLAAFKAQAGEFSTNPSKFISVFEGCLASCKPDWDDCNVLMRTLLSEVERNQVVSKEKEKRQAKMMVAAVQAGGRGKFQEGGKGRGMRGRGRPGSQERRLGRNQCARCRKKGHWKNECPEREGTPMMAAEDQE